MFKADPASRVIGVWRLVSCTRDIIETNEHVHQYGEDPLGYLHYSREGRMMVFMQHRKRPVPHDILATDAEAVALFRTMGAYMGTFTVEANRVTHHIDASWNQSWACTTQHRYFRVEGD